jgi:hypothetical protein
MDVLAALEHVHLAAPDHRDRERPHRERAAVEQVLPASGADPDQLVVVVAVRLARRLAPELRSLEPQHLHRAAVEAVDGEAGHAASSARSAFVAVAPMLPLPMMPIRMALATA